MALRNGDRGSFRRMKGIFLGDRGRCVYGLCKLED